MSDGINNSVFVENEIDLREIFKILKESRKFLISTILIFTIASIIYSFSLKPSFLSSTNLEIGYFYEENGYRELIESPSDLISDLNILLLKNPDDKFSQNVAISSLEGKVINLETTSISAEQNENLLTEMINYIVERHSNLLLLKNNQQKDEISHQIDMIESKISFLKSKESNERQIMRSEIEDRIAVIKNISPLIDLEISQLEKVIIDDTRNLSLLREANKLAERAANTPTLEQVIFIYNREINDLNSKKYKDEIEVRNLNNQLKILENDVFQSDELFSLEQEKAILKKQMQMLMIQTEFKTRLIGNTETSSIKPRTQLIIIVGLILGFFTGIFLILIRSFVNSYKES